MTAAAFRRVLRDTLAAFDAAGRPIMAAHVRADGSVDLLTTEVELAHPADEADGGWADLAGEADTERA